MKKKLLESELCLLNVHHPHKFVYIYLHILGLLHKESDPNATKEQINRSKELLQKAWSFMNDGLRTDIFLRYTPETIACACIQLAAKTVEHPVILPKSPPWFELFDVSDCDVRLISKMLMCLYTRTRAPSLDFINSELKLYQKEPSDSNKKKEGVTDKAYADIQKVVKERAVKASKKDDEKAAKIKEIRIKHVFGPPFHVMVDASFISYFVKNRLDIMKGFKDCLRDKVIPYIPKCVIAELERKERRFKAVLEIINDRRWQRLHCSHKKSIYPDECIIHRVEEHKNCIVATCDRDLRRRIRKILDVPIIYIRHHKLTIERMG
uniref:Uncharacterized protein n=1 Tax=Meloidogyne enterolobii TaxID=390850 RepID=A0A6V7VAG9_MELEN|nr:unnamed protein product [Meloidogyne enterolobii]